MDSFLKAALAVLKAKATPLTTQEIVDTAIQHGWLKTAGLTPHKTMNARLSEHILVLQHNSMLMRVGPAEFGLREWSQEIPEYIAPRRKLNPIEEDILVFDSTLIEQFATTDGLNPAKFPSLSKLVKSTFSMRRADAEENLNVVQLISSFVITHRGTVLTYRRSKRLPEKRLQDAYSANFGGHITYEDQMPLFGLYQKKFVDLFMRRELDEEVRFCPPPQNLRFKGFLYDSKTQIGRQHIGIVFHVPVTNSNYKIGERGFLLGDAFETKSVLESKLNDFDSWSRYLLKEYLHGNW